jgi:hypothetical protein
VQEARILTERKGGLTGGGGAESSHIERRKNLTMLRKQQEAYYAKKFKRIYPLGDKDEPPTPKGART